MNNSIAIVGAGKMGSAFCRGLLNSDTTLSVLLADRHQENLDQFPGITTSTSVLDVVHQADYILLAVKPQSFSDLCAELGAALKDKCVLSIMAGITLANLSQKTGTEHVVRAMPNLGVQVGRGLTAWIAADAVGEDENSVVRHVFRKVGKDMQLSSEEALEHFTTIVGCGPAYVFRLTDILACEAERRGFSKDDARLMAEETLMGSAKLLETGNDTAGQWVQAVASKGGVTEAALQHLSEGGMHSLFSEAIDKALYRQRELGG